MIPLPLLDPADPCREHKCVFPADSTVYVDMNEYAIPYKVCALHYTAAERGEPMTFRHKDGLLCGYRIVTNHTDKPLRNA